MAKQRDEQNQPQPEGPEDVLHGDLGAEPGKPATDARRKPTTQLKAGEAGDEPGAPRAPKTPQPETVPDMSLDEPAAAERPPTMPDLSLDEPAAAEGPPAIPDMSLDELAEAESAAAEPEGIVTTGSDIIVAEPVAPAGSDIIVAEPAGGAGSDIVVAETLAGSDIIVAEPLGAGGSSVVEAAPVEAGAVEELPEEIVVSAEATPQPPGRPDSDIFVGEFLDEGDAVVSTGSSVVVAAQPVSEVLDAEPISEVASAIVVGAAPASDVIEAEEVHGSSVFEAQPASDLVAGEEVSNVEAVEIFDDAEEVEEASSATRKDESVLEEELAAASAKSQPESPLIFEAEEAEDEEPEAVEAADDATEEADVLEAEAAPVGSSAVNWDEIGTGSSAVEAAEAAEIDETVAYDSVEGDLLGAGAKHAESSAVDLGKPHGTKEGASSSSGIDPVAEALESGVGLEESSSGSKKRGEPSVEFDDLLTDDVPARSSGKARRKDGDKVVGKGTDEEDIFSEIGVTAEDAEVAEEDEAEAVEAVDDPEAEAAEALFDDDESSAEVAAALDEGTGEEDLDAEVADAEDAEADEDEAPKTRRKAARAAVEDEDEEEEAPVAARGKKGKRELVGAGPRPRRAVHWLGGTILGMLIAAGAVAGVVYYAPDMIEKLPDAPIASKEQINQARTQTEQANRKLQQTSQDLQQANAELVVQKARAAKADELDVQVKQLMVGDKAFAEVRAVLEKAKVANPGARPEELPAALGQVLMDKEQAEKVVGGIGQALAAAKFIEDKAKLDVGAFQKLIKDLSDQRATLAAVNKLLEDAKINEAGDKGVEKLQAARKEAEDKLGDVNKVLTDEKSKEEGAKGVLEIVEARNKLHKDRDELAAVVKAAVDELAEAKIVAAAGDPRKVLVEGTRMARLKAESPLSIPLGHLGGALGNIGSGMGQLIDTGLMTARLATELTYYQLREPLIAAPRARLDTHISVLQDRGQRDPLELAAVLRETEWLLSKDAGADAESRAKAHLAAGLAFRNQGKYDEARKSLSEAVSAGKGMAKPGPWAAHARQALEELTDPAAYYLPRIEGAREAGNLKESLAHIHAALEAIPASGNLLAERALVQLEAARRRGKIDAAAQKAVRADVAAARKDAGAAAAGAYVLGQLEEDLGNFEAAEQLYREAIKSNQDVKGPLQEGYRYRIALARLLQRERVPAAAAPEPAEPPAKDDKKAEEKTSSLLPGHPLSGLVAALALGAQPAEEDENPAATRRLRESVKLAEELIASDDPKVKGQGHVLLGQALSKQGRRTEGLREVARGMALLFPGLNTQEMGKLLDEHPAFQHPDATRDPNPVIAERFFGLGLHDYWERRYAEAEARFKQAVAHYDQDARYQYFLGLAQLAQRTQIKRDAAYYSFEKGARLEAAARPSIAEINGSLERVQGDLRQLLNSFRIRVLAKNTAETPG
jgi:hypothetical protein